MLAYPDHQSGWSGSTCKSHLNVKRTKKLHPGSRGVALVIVNNSEHAKIL